MSSARQLRRPRRIVLGSVLGVATLLVATACSSSGKPSGKGGGSVTGAAPGSTNSSCATAHKKLNLGFVYADTTQNPFQEMDLGARAAAEQDGNVNLKENAPTPLNNTQEVSMFQAMARQATDGIAYETVAPDLFYRAVKNATSAGVPVVAVDAAPPKNAGVKLFVANSNTELGRMLGDAFVKQNPNPSGTVVLGNDIPSLVLLQQRLQGVQQVIKQKLPNMKVLGPYNTGSTNTENYTLWKSVVSAHSGATAYIGVGGEDGVSLPLIEKQTGAKFLIGSADIPTQALQAVKSGKIFALSSPEHWMKGYIAMYELIHAKRTCTPMPTGWWNSGNLVIDKSNIDAVLARQKSNQARFNYFKPEIAKQLANPPIQPMSAAN